VDLTIDQYHRYLFAVFGHELRIIEEGELLEPDIRLVNNLPDRVMGPLAQVTPRSADQGDRHLTQNPQPPFVPSSKKRETNNASER